MEYIDNYEICPSCNRSTKDDNEGCALHRNIRNIITNYSDTLDEEILFNLFCELVDSISDTELADYRDYEGDV